MKRSSFFRRSLFALAVGGSLILPTAVPARADVMIMPIRIVFGSRDRMEDITVFNSSRTISGTYSLSWLNVEQTEDGDYKRLDHPLDPELDPATAILFSPRQVTLPPGGKQRVRLSLRRPAELPDGEYRAHLFLKNSVSQPAMSAHLKGKKGEEGAAIGMSMNVGLAVPVIIRQGPYDGAASIEAPRFAPADPSKKSPPKVEFYINHSGKFSTIGNVRVYWTPPDGKEELVAQQNAVNIFREVPRRLMKIPMKLSQVSGGKIRIIFEGDGPDKGITFDEKTFPVGG